LKEYVKIEVLVWMPTLYVACYRFRDARRSSKFRSIHLHGPRLFRAIFISSLA